MASIYHIRIKSHLDESWSASLCDLAMTHEAGGTTLLTGPVADQSALLGLHTLRDACRPIDQRICDTALVATPEHGMLAH